MNPVLVWAVMSQGWHLAVEPYVKQWEEAEL